MILLCYENARRMNNTRKISQRQSSYYYNQLAKWKKRGLSFM